MAPTPVAPIVRMNRRFAAEGGPALIERCWVWPGAKSGGGYGQISGAGRRLFYTHRVAYEAWYGPIPEGLVIDHLCGNPACCNPTHLEAVTQGENTLRGRGPSAANARLERCRNGHEFHVQSDGKRRCLTCRRAWYRARRSGR